MSKNKKIIEQIQQQLQQQSNAAHKKALDSYFKNVVQNRGIQSPKIRQVIKNLDQEINALQIDEKILLFQELLKSDYHEDQIASTYICSKYSQQLQKEDIDSLKQIILQNYVKSWAVCDSLAISVLRPWAKQSEEKTRYIYDWTKNDQSTWLRRCFLVSQVTLAKHGDKGNFNGYIDLLFEGCSNAIVHQERFNQLGVGWLLREIYLSNNQKTIDYIKNNYDLFIREGLRYAIEKMKPKQKNELLNYKKIVK